jgi:hypothetical protein
MNSSSQQIERFMAGGVHTLEMFGVPTQVKLRKGNPQTEIVQEIKEENSIW